MPSRTRPAPFTRAKNLPGGQTSIVPFPSPAVAACKRPSRGIDRAVERGAKVVVCPGYLFAEAVAQAAQAHTDVAFIAVDCQLPDEAPANAVGLVYAEEQAGLFWPAMPR